MYKFVYDFSSYLMWKSMVYAAKCVQLLLGIWLLFHLLLKLFFFVVQQGIVRYWTCWFSVSLCFVLFLTADRAFSACSERCFYLQLEICLPAVRNVIATLEHRWWIVPVFVMISLRIWYRVKYVKRRWCKPRKPIGRSDRENCTHWIL